MLAQAIYPWPGMPTLPWSLPHPSTLALALSAQEPLEGHVLSISHMVPVWKRLTFFQPRVAVHKKKKKLSVRGASSDENSSCWIKSFLIFTLLPRSNSSSSWRLLETQWSAVSLLLSETLSSTDYFITRWWRSGHSFQGEADRDWAWNHSLNKLTGSVMGLGVGQELINLSALALFVPKKEP